MSGRTPSRPLDAYNARRDFARTAEPPGRRGRRRTRKLAFLVQKHDARRLHYDLRLEWDGVLKSWAVTKGPSLDPADKRLAVRTEDHPLSYGDFEGVIPEGEYGAGTVMLWDTGAWEPKGDPDAGLSGGKLHFIAHGERMKGEWILVRMAARKREKRENWLLIKADDDAARISGRPLIERETKSVASERGMDAIARNAEPDVGERPGFEAPQLARLVSEAPAGDDWLHEVKFDGYRCLVAIGGGTVRCYTRGGHDWTDRFAGIADAAADLECGRALIDGEVVAAGQSGSSTFSALQAALKSGGSLRFYAFDLLSLDGEDLRKRPLIERKERLATLLESAGRSGVLRYSEHVRGSGPEVFRSICRAGQEGIVSKRADAPYSGRRNGAWRKVKCTRRQEFVIGGYSPSDKRGRPFASLLLGSFENGALRYRGRVGTGFSGAVMEQVAAALKPLARKTAPFDKVPAAIARHARWVTPKQVAEVDFTEFTADGHVRHGVFLGLREDKDAREVRMETPGRTQDADGHLVAGIRITHPDRAVYPEQGLTKIALARYYERVADRMLAHVAGRPLSLVRCPQGRRKSCFFQKHAGTGFPDPIRRVAIEESSGETESYMYVRDAAGLVSAVQMGTLEFHLWWSRIDALERPERLVFDLDPDEGLAFSEVRAAAFDMHGRLADIGLESLPLVTGGKGIHVTVPLVRRATAADVGRFAEAFARTLAGDAPKRYTATASKAKRKGRIFIDWLRNRRGATAIAPYSTRAREGGPVAMPVAWDELATLESARGFRVADVLERIETDDPWKAASGWRQSITRAMHEAVGA
ncbi:DNA ligase D [Oceanibacterium hippocampi]|uniref:DNA ligase (ATP) n=1 Tax=Oceanibacterium hippocampi TaxID=745714 RepID=A0A1Y5ST56_9PROT|nr:DNA ligase D [Oceanibacterium hippocampi]SLN47210.1 Putative DNA ligase-like protein/MT0965 [Oceanibacterium hippocampi]